MKRIALLSLFLLSACQDNQNKSQQTKSKNMNEVIPGKTITIDQLEAMFANISQKTDWNIGGDMLWGYFFTNHEPSALEPLRDELVSDGYRFVDLYQSDEDDQDGPRVWWLHIEREETHTPKSLDLRNNDLYLLAHRYGVDSYDGMDIGPIKQQSEQVAAPDS